MQNDTGTATIPPELTGRYTSFRRLGAGGGGEVYRALDTILDKVVAIKLLRQATANPETAIRFQQEAKVASKLKHRNIVTLMDFGITAKGSPYLVMECAEGTSLDQILEDYGALPMEAALNIILQVCEGMEHAHNNGIVHRDLKPSNIMVDGDNLVTATVKVLDFGIAKLENNDRTASSITKPGFIVGTPHYMSPEQFTESNVDRRSDIYAVGCIIFRILTGRFSFDGESMLEIMQDKQYSAPRLSDFAENVPEGIDSIVAKCLEIQPEDRYQSMTKLREDLEIELEQLKEQSTYQQTVEAPTKRKKRERTLRISLLACYALLFACVIPLFFTALVTSRDVKAPNKSDNVMNEIPMAERIQKQFSVNKATKCWIAQGTIQDSELEYLASQKADEVRLIVFGNDNTLSNQGSITERGYEALSRIPLVQLNACRTSLDDKALVHISKIPTLIHLDITQTKVTDEGLENLRNNSTIRELLVIGDSITHDGIKSISTMKRLETLYLDDTRIGDNDLLSLPNLPRLASLRLNSCKVTDVGMDTLSKIRTLRDIDLGKTTVTADGFRKLKNLKLTHIHVESSPTFNDECLSVIAKQWPHLIFLDVNDTRITAKGVQSIGQLRELEVLSLNTLPVTDEDIEPIFHLPKLNKVNLTLNRNLTDKTPERLAKMPSLKEVELTCCSGITERGYSVLARDKKMNIQRYERDPDAVLDYGSLLDLSR